MVFNQAFKFFNIDDTINVDASTSTSKGDQLINFDFLTQQLKKNPLDFENLRRGYNLRQELTHYE